MDPNQTQVKTIEKLTYSSGILGQNMIYNMMAMYILFILQIYY